MGYNNNSNSYNDNDNDNDNNNNDNNENINSNPPKVIFFMNISKLRYDLFFFDKFKSYHTVERTSHRNKEK